MLFLASAVAPRNLEELVQAITAPLREVLEGVGDRAVVDARGVFPKLDQLVIDLTGARVDPKRRMPVPRAAGKAGPGITVAALSVVGKPVTVEMGRVSFEITAADVRMDLDTDTSSGKLLLVPVSVREGRGMVEISRADLEALILSQAKPLAAQQGANLTDVKLDIQRLGDRSLAVNVRAAAKKFMMSGAVHLSARVDVTEDLKARISRLDCRGEGVAGTIASGFIKPKLKEMEGREVVLARFSLGEIRLRDVRVTSVDPVRVEVGVE